MQVETHDFGGMQGGEKQGKVQKLSKNEVLMLNIGSMCTGARVIAVGLHCVKVEHPDFAVVHDACTCDLMMIAQGTLQGL